MSSGVMLSGEEFTEELEHLVNLLKELVENLKKNLIVTKDDLKEFMPKYICIEDKIIKLLKTNPTTQVDNRHIEELIHVCNIYLRDYQDEWDNSYWNIYNEWYSKMYDFNSPNPIFDDERSLEDHHHNLEISLDLAAEKFKNYQGKDKTRGSTHDETFNITTTNINKIDEELKEVKEIDFTKPPREEKKRGCLDNCLIF